MKPHVGKKLVVESEILKAQNTEVGILVGDDDSSTIAACRNASDHPILKRSDKNHASGGLRKQLYEMQKKIKELTKERITYLHRCFTFAVSQNLGNDAEMANAIRSIPLHACNDHTVCGAWCGYHDDPEKYEHSSVPGGFTDPKLSEELRRLFNKLADNAGKFALGASSNRNESFHAMVPTKAPKQRCYSRTPFFQFRLACSVGHKNMGTTYTQEITDKITLSPGKYHSRHIAKYDRAHLRTRNIINTHQFKQHRAQQKKIRAALRYRKKNQEGLTYESNCGRLT
ncbi:uncharacterized protein LOC107043683 [Diachasma alloeum]|uniref:uncharacterized protein LOC107043683 n=1 Tax=Diachasma alloeum TaxID=454923 RepID=UPI000738503D|nr:uncharacterized protein LOC107043683 [Diachasma alloeum]